MKAFRRSLIGYFAVLLIGQCMFAIPASALPASEGLCLTPPMGWSSWNWFGCYNGTRPQLYPGGGIDEAKLIQTANAMLAPFNGVSMKDAGYEYVNIDDCYLENRRDATGGLVAKKKTFPKGMRAMGDSIRAKGLKFGIYTCIFENTCATKYDGAQNGQPGMWQNEQRDADTFVAWGVDYVKIDYCGFESYVAGKTPAQKQAFATANYNKVAKCLKEAVRKAKAAGKPAKEMVFSICEWGDNKPWLWGDSLGHLWRTAHDITKSYGSMMQQIDAIIGIADSTGPGGWNDPDMMQVGNFGTPTEIKIHYCLWSIMAAPMIAGNDLRTMNDFVKGLYTNNEVNGVNQDSLGKSGKLVQGKTTGTFVISKRQRNGDHAVLFVNNGTSPATMSVSWDTVSKFSPVKLTATDKFKVRDLLNKTDVGEFTGSFTSPAPIASHDCYFFKINSSFKTGVIMGQRVAAQKANTFDFSIARGTADVKISSAFKNRFSFTVCDLKGTVLHKAYGQGATALSIPLQKIGRGIYFITMKSADRAVTKQLILR